MPVYYVETRRFRTARERYVRRLVLFLYIFLFLFIFSLPGLPESALQKNDTHVQELVVKPEPLEDRKAIIEMEVFARVHIYDEMLNDFPMGPLDNNWDTIWNQRPGLQENFQLEDRVQEMSSRVEITMHEVQPGETLWDISQKYGIDVATLAGANHDIENVHRIRPGMELRILSIRGTIHKVQEGETLSDIACTYDVSTEDLLRNNENLDAQKLSPGVEIIVPGVEPLDYADRGGTLDSFVWPVEGGWISSPFGMRWGRMHEGLDIAVNTGTPVVASKSGWVQFSGWNGGYGNTVDIYHGGGVMTRYAHNSRLVVRSGQFVHQGQVIAYSGNTGSSTGPHLHFEIRHNDRPVNPIHYLPPR